MNWRQRLAAAGDAHADQLEVLLQREFKTLLASIDPAKPAHAQTAALRAHAGRLAAILASQKWAAALTFGFMALEMLAPNDGGNPAAIQGKAEKPAAQPTRAQRVAEVLREMARTVSTGAAIRATAERLARDRALVSAVQTAILIAPDDSPRVIAARLLETPRAAALLAQAHAEATGANALTQALAEAATGDPGATGSGRNNLTPTPGSSPTRPPTSSTSGAGGPPRKPPAPPAGGFSRPPPPRSRFSQLVERLVREQAPVRARRIASTSGRIVAGALGDAAAVGQNPEKAARLLEERLGGQVSRQRARVIARTELGAAQNAATLAIARDRAAAGEVLVKVWAAIDDARTRPSHAEADNQVRALDEAFLVGHSAMQHPGDPAAPVGELVNCRCALIIRAPIAADRRAARR